jgi:hypothetical protein
MLQKNDLEAKAIIFVDDFIGTGNTLSTELAKIPHEVKQSLDHKGISVFLLVVAGYSEGIRAVESAIEQSGLNLRLHVCDHFDSEETPFEERSKIFALKEERTRAKDLVYEYGIQLDPDAPFGYGGTQATVVFENKIPNNCPPILWKQKGAWKPLFRRT